MRSSIFSVLVAVAITFISFEGRAAPSFVTAVCRILLGKTPAEIFSSTKKAERERYEKRYRELLTEDLAYRLFRGTVHLYETSPFDHASLVAGQIYGQPTPLKLLKEGFVWRNHKLTLNHGQIEPWSNRLGIEILEGIEDKVAKGRFKTEALEELKSRLLNFEERLVELNLQENQVYHSEKLTIQKHIELFQRLIEIAEKASRRGLPFYTPVLVPFPLGRKFSDAIQIVDFANSTYDELPYDIKAKYREGAMAVILEMRGVRLREFIDLSHLQKAEFRKIFEALDNLSEITKFSSIEDVFKLDELEAGRFLAYVKGPYEKDLLKQFIYYPRRHQIQILRDLLRIRRQHPLQNPVPSALVKIGGREIMFGDLTKTIVEILNDPLSLEIDRDITESLVYPYNLN